MPTRIICLRHAEEPADAIDQYGPGFNEFGHLSENGLSIRGWLRAGALAATDLCGLVPREELHSSLDVFVPNYGGEPDHHRASMTIAPFARKINTKLRSDWNKKEVGADELVADLLAVASVAVVCWDHENLAFLVDKLVNGVGPGDAEADGLAWPKGRFDLIWVLSSNTGQPPYRLEQHSQCLLPDDVSTDTSAALADP